MRSWLTHSVAAGEEGHAMPLLGALVGAAGVILLGIGAANDNDALAIAGGIVAAAGIVGYDLLRHIFIDYEFFRRTQK
ncbi:MAG: hypothetical protein Kow0010_16840 [Dehalococcoidia bacterium]